MTAHTKQEHELAAGMSGAGDSISPKRHARSQKHSCLAEI